MIDIYDRPRHNLDCLSRSYPGIWKQVEAVRAKRKELGDWPSWCFMPVALAEKIMGKGLPLHAAEQYKHTPPDRPTHWEVGYRLGAALRRASAERSSEEPTGTHSRPRPHIRRAHWHSYWVGKWNEPDARAVVLKWLPPIAVTVQHADDLTTTVRDVGHASVTQVTQ
jgi:hypothetical protein